MRRYLLARLSEGSALRGLLILIGGLAGFNLSESDAVKILAALNTLAGMVGMFLPDRWGKSPAGSADVVRVADLPPNIRAAIADWAAGRNDATPMDDIDRAQERQLVETERALQSRAATPQATHTQLICAESGQVLCWQCLEPIPAERLLREPKAGFCVPCQTATETCRKNRREN
jgi:RNA polymerase-binding transcription factor DksA